MNIKRKNLQKNRKMLSGNLKKNGFMLWRHTFNGVSKKNDENKVFFVEFFIINPASSSSEPIFGQFYEQKTKKHHPSYIMIKAGSWGVNGKQIHEFYPISVLQFDRKSFNLKLNSIHISETNLAGAVCMSQTDVVIHPEYMSDAGSMLWNLTMEKTCSYNPSKSINWHVQGIQAQYSGIVMLDDIEYLVTPEKSFGYADKTWGRDFGSPFLWLFASNFVSEITQCPLDNCCFAISVCSSCAQVKNGQQMPKFLAVFYYEGIKYEFPLTFLHKKSKVKVDFIESDDTLHWIASAETKKHLFDVDIFCPKKETIFMNYESPNGHKYHNNLWSGGTGTGQIKFFEKDGQKLELIESARIENAGCQYGEFDMLDFI